MKYPKIETLWNRDKKTFKVIPDDYRKEEFALVNKWLITEKVDGTNIRIIYDPDTGVTFGGRTDNAQMPIFLLNYLTETFTDAILKYAFPEATTKITLFGEGYGVKIQKGGNYRPEGVSFRLFDVAVEGTSKIWWLKWEAVEDIATSLGVFTVPWVGVHTTAEAVELVERISVTALQDGGNMGYLQEGIVARTDPYLHTRSGGRLVWKLKRKDLI